MGFKNLNVNVNQDSKMFLWMRTMYYVTPMDKLNVNNYLLHRNLAQNSLTDFPDISKNGALEEL